MAEKITPLPVTLVIGDDGSSIAAFLEERAQSLGDAGVAELNLARLDGKTASGEEIRTAACAAPFLAEHRMLILTNPLARVSNDEARNRMVAFIETIPPTSEVIFILEDHQVYRQQQRQWDTFNANHWLIKRTASMKGQVLVVEKPLPTPQEMPGWIQKKAQEMGGRFTPAAAMALANHLDNNTRLARLEIEKLLTYVDFKRPVDPDDVDLLTANTSQASVFDMVDALGSGNIQIALQLFHRLLEEEEEASLFGMIVRQFRLLLQTREILDEGLEVEDVIRELKLHKYPARKMVGQARRFSISRLQDIYHRLQEIDVQIKSSQTTLPLAFDLLAAEIARC